MLLAHSQGGIIMSTWVVRLPYLWKRVCLACTSKWPKRSRRSEPDILVSHMDAHPLRPARTDMQDQLLADFAAEQLAKVEIYTFAAAANHFSVLYTLVNAAKKSKKAEKADANGTPEGAAVEGNEQGDRRFVFGAVEHFANTKDYVAQIGTFLSLLLGYHTGILEEGMGAGFRTGADCRVIASPTYWFILAGKGFQLTAEVYSPLRHSHLPAPSPTCLITTSQPRVDLQAASSSGSALPATCFSRTSRSAVAPRQTRKRRRCPS